VTNETQVLLITLCQLNREIEKRNNFVPCSSDLRDSGQLEQDADAVIFGVWPHRVKPDCDPNLYQFFVSKNRNRDINQRAVQCRFEPGRQRFLDEAASYKSPFNY